MSADGATFTKGVRVFLRSGSHFDIVDGNVKAEHSPATGELTRLAWTDPTSGRPLFVRLDSVDAVVCL